MNSQLSFQKSNNHQPSNYSSTNKNINKKVIILSIFYLLVAISYTSFSNIIVYLHQKYKHKGYGQAYLTANSLTSLFSYIFCPLFLSITQIPSSKLLILCSSTYLLAMLIPSLFSISQQLINPSETIRPPSTFRFLSEMLVNGLVGIGSVIFWVLNGMYMTNYCSDLPEHKKGKYFSISNTIINMRTVVAPLFTIFGLGFGNEIVYFSLLTFIVILALSFPTLAIPNIPLKQSEQHLISITQQALSQNVKPKHTCKQISFHFLSFFVYFRKVSLLLPCSIVSGLMMGFVSSSLSHLLPNLQDPSQNDSNISISLLLFGIGSIIGGYMSGYACDTYTIKKAGYLGNILIIIACIIESYFLSITPSLLGASIVGFFSGVSYSFLFSYMMVVCTIHFNGCSSSFAVIRFVNVIFYITYQWFVIFYNNTLNMKQNMIYQSLFLIPFAIFSCYCIKMLCKKYQQEKKNKKNTSMVQISSKKNYQEKDVEGG